MSKPLSPPFLSSLLMLNDVTVQRGDMPLCLGVNLRLHAGQVCHLIGANGAGKTTLLMQIAGLLPVLQGAIYYNNVLIAGSINNGYDYDDGDDSEDNRHNDNRNHNNDNDIDDSTHHTKNNTISTSTPFAPLYVSHQLGIHPNLTVAQNLTFLLNLYGIAPSKAHINAALDWVGLQGFEGVGSNQLSAGQTRRIALARLYLMPPTITPLWLLDEPFTALDVAMVAKLSEHISEFGRQGGAVLMTSHQPVSIATQTLDLTEYML